MKIKVCIICTRQEVDILTTAEDLRDWFKQRDVSYWKWIQQEDGKVLEVDLCTKVEFGTRKVLINGKHYRYVWWWMRNTVLIPEKEFQRWEKERGSIFWVVLEEHIGEFGSKDYSPLQGKLFSSKEEAEKVAREYLSSRSTSSSDGNKPKGGINHETWYTN